MKKQKYLAFMLSLSLAASCSVVNAQTLDESMPVITNQADETPIIQDDKIIGAVTHVVVDNPKKGYGIYITNMLKEMEK